MLSVKISTHGLTSVAHSLCSMKQTVLQRGGEGGGDIIIPQRLMSSQIT